MTVQCCGDCHLMNFGGFATPERTLVFDINDFDETHPGLFEWDIKRLADQTPERREIIFDPVPRVDGIDSSGDPLTEVRADIYRLSGRRRRGASGK